ncbi:MAG: DUF166 family protein [Candidatus Hermodarchaeota archaeon]
MKVLILSDGKYGDRAIKVVQKKFPDAEFILIREENPMMFMDDVHLENEIETAIDIADLLILYIRHPDVVAEICMRQKPTILPVHFGEGFLNQIKALNPKVIQPISMCNALPNTGISELDEFFNKFGSPKYEIKLEYSKDNQPIIKEINLKRESPCGSSYNTLEHIRGKSITLDTLNNFALSVRQECREPMSIVFKRDFSETAGTTHLLKLIDAIKKEDPSLLRNDTFLRDYISKLSELK